VRRAFVIVVDACGAGPLPDSAGYGDAGADTLRHVAEAVGGLKLPALAALGLGNIAPLPGVAAATHPAMHGRLHPLGAGKDSTCGHRELMGLPGEPLPTYPHGFPDEVLAVISRAAGHPGVLCNRPCDGMRAIEHFGAEHLHSGLPILYTSQDSVLQIAAHGEVIDEAALHALCRQVRRELPAEHAVGRVIARPFTGSPGAFRRTEGRLDLALPPPGRTYLDELQQAGVPVHAVGKAGALFAFRGVDVEHHAPDNASALAATDRLIAELPEGLVFANLIETDQVYGHRHDCPGFHRALQEIDRRVAGWLGRLGAGDLLVLTADHGCDPAASHSDHTREHVPLLACFPAHGSRRHDGPMADVGASVLDWLAGRASAELPGSSFLGQAPGDDA
jgi:phosphopentomutase